jgi:hypothetical protein
MLANQFLSYPGDCSLINNLLITKVSVAINNPIDRFLTRGRIMGQIVEIYNLIFLQHELIVIQVTICVMKMDRQDKQRNCWTSPHPIQQVNSNFTRVLMTR